MPFDPAVTFDKAEAARVQKLSIGRQRQAPSTLGVLEEAAARHTYRIFNVGPWPQHINTGSYGYFTVPSCPKDKEYVQCPRTIKGIESELIIKDESRYDRLDTDGWKFALEVVGDGRGRDPQQSYRHYGLFASKNEIPTADEIFQAKTMLHARCSEIVREARDLYAMDRKQFSVVVKRERHFVAAEVLNLNDEPWMVEQTPSVRKKCAFCGTMNEDFAVKCAKCSEIIDPVRYKALKDQQDEILEPKRGPGRPRKVEEPS